MLVVAERAPAGTVTVTVWAPSEALTDPPAAVTDWVVEPDVGGRTTGGVCGGELEPPPHPAMRSAAAERIAARLYAKRRYLTKRRESTVTRSSTELVAT